MEIGNIYELITGKLENWLSTAIEMLPNLVLAILVVILFYVLAKIIKSFAGKLLSQVTANQTITTLAQTIINVLVLGVGVFFALSILNLDGTVTSLLAGAGIIGLALGLAFQNIVTNFISGILLSVSHPFGIGDVIEINELFGTVIELTLRNTVIRTPQGQIMYVPNKEVYENPFTNYTKNGERRIDLACRVSYGDDLEKAKKIAIEAVSGINARDKGREIQLYYNEFGHSSISFVIRFWIGFTKPVHYWKGQNEAIIAIKKAFDENDIMIPFPIKTLDFGVRRGEKLNEMLPQSEREQSS